MVRKDKRRPAKPNATGRNDKSGRFVALPHRILESVAYASLDLTARGLLTELVMLFKGDNNGAIYLSALDGTARLGLTDKRPVLRAFEDLQDRGFITMAKDGYFRGGSSDLSRARCWRLTWHAWPECPQRTKRAPTNEWENYSMPAATSPEGKRANRRADSRLRALAKYRKAAASGRFSGVNFTPLGADMARFTSAPGVNFTPANSRNDENPPFSIGGDFTPYLDDTMGCSVRSWWSTDTEHRLWAQILLLFIVAQNRPLELARAA